MNYKIKRTGIEYEVFLKMEMWTDVIKISEEQKRLSNNSQDSLKILGA